VALFCPLSPTSHLSIVDTIIRDSPRELTYLALRFLSSQPAGSAMTRLPPSGLFRRLGALLYDSLLLLALLMIGTACFLPFTGGEALRFDTFPVLTLIHRLVLVLLIVAFYGVFWRRRGQTLGMASWRLRVEREDGSLLEWRDVVLRIGAGVLSLLPAGLGWAWILVDRDKRAWHDRLSHTRVVVLPRDRRARSN
jgi:uncharacterized RDD family membrane protein YckC